jgi:hypothetical protein
MALKFNPFTGNFDIVNDAIPVHDVEAQASAFNAEAGKTYMVTGTAYTITLPASPATDDYIVIKDAAGNASTNNKTVSGNGNNIDGSATHVINSDYASHRYVFDGSNWFIV